MNPNVVLSDYTSDFSSKRKQNKEKYQFGVTSTYIFLLGFIIILLLYYVWTLNTNATKGYNIRTLEIEKNALLLEKELLEVKMAELESLGTILKGNEADDMEKVTDPDYLVIKDGVQYVYSD